MAIVSICAKKGGNGKTTTAINFAIGLATMQKRVLLIDMDSQCNLSSGIGVYNPDLVSLESVLLGQCQVSQAIQRKKNLDIIQSELTRNELESTFKDDPDKLKRLRAALETIKDEYEYIIIDTPPAIGFLTQSALIASDEVIIVSQADKFSLDGLYQLDKEINQLKNKYNPKLRTSGILITRYVPQTSMRRMIREELVQIAKKLNTKIYETSIRETVAIPESQVRKMSVYKHRRNSNGAQDYCSFVKEYLRDNGEKVSDLLFLKTDI